MPLALNLSSFRLLSRPGCLKGIVGIACDVQEGPTRFSARSNSRYRFWSALPKSSFFSSISYSQIVSWGFGDAIFGTNYDNISSTIKLRRAGFPDCIDTEEVFCTLFDQLRRKRIIP